MTDIEEKALELLNEVEIEREGHPIHETIKRHYSAQEALCRAIEQHEAFKQEVSDAVEKVIESCAVTSWGAAMLDPLIIPKPKPDTLKAAAEYYMSQFGQALEAHGIPYEAAQIEADTRLRAALEAYGLEIREKKND